MSIKSDKNLENSKNKDSLSWFEDYDINFISNNNNNLNEEKKEILEQVFQESKNFRNHFFKNYLFNFSENLDNRSDKNSYQYMNFFRNTQNIYNKHNINIKKRNNKDDEELKNYEKNATIEEKERDEQKCDIPFNENKNNNLMNENKIDDSFNFEKENCLNDKEANINFFVNPVGNDNFYSEDNKYLDNDINKSKNEKDKSNINEEDSNNNNTILNPSNNIIEEANTYFINRRIRFHIKIDP